MIIVGFLSGSDGDPYSRTQADGSLVADSSFVETEDREILVAVFRNQIRNCYQLYSPRVFLLSYKGQDPPDDVIAKFTSYGNRVRRRSEKPRMDESASYQIVLGIRKVERTGKSSARVFGSCSAGLLDAKYYIYNLRSEHGVWQVKRRSLSGVT